MEAVYTVKDLGLSQSGPIDKLKKNNLLYDISIISITEGYFYDGKTDPTNPDGNLEY